MTPGQIADTPTPAAAQSALPNLREADLVIKDFAFASGEILPELRLHYRALGTEKRNAAGEISNAVVLLHGTSGSGADWLRPSLANELFGAGHDRYRARDGDARRHPADCRETE